MSLSNPLQVHEVVGAKLIDDARKQLLQALGLPVTSDSIGVRRNRSLHLRRSKMDDSAILLEHVDLFDSRDVVNTKTLKLSLQLFLICGVRCMLLELLATNSA